MDKNDPAPGASQPAPIPSTLRLPSGFGELWLEHGHSFTGETRRDFYRHLRDRGVTGNDLPLPYWLHGNVAAAIQWRLRALDAACRGLPIYSRKALKERLTRTKRRRNAHKLLKGLERTGGLQQHDGTRAIA